MDATGLGRSTTPGDGNRVNILLVDDQSSKLLSYEAILGELGENLIKAGSATEALDKIMHNDIAVVLVDVCMPDLDGFELASMIRDHPRFQRMSIIFVSAIALTDFDRLKGYQHGAVDYIPVPIDADLLKAKVRVFAELYRKTRQLEDLNAVLEQRVADRTAELAKTNAELELRVAERTRQLEVTNERLRQAQKLEAVGQLTGGVAHDFNNLLTAILGNFELLARLNDNERARRLIDAGRQAVQRGARLTQSLLAFARRQILRPEIVDVNRTIEEFAELLRRAVGDTVEMKLALGQDVGSCCIDATQLLSALMNLAINSRDAMPASGGRITIATESVTLDERSTANDPEVDPGRYICIKLTDNGAGMSPDVLARAFEPFFTTKEFGAGNGLGLSQVYGFAKQSGGFVQLESDVGAGTTVRLHLPRHAAASSAADEPARMAAVPQAHPARREAVLVVEDDPDVRTVMAASLAAIGYTVHVAKDGPTALAALRNGESIDILFSDIAMPNGMTGHQLGRQAVAEYPGLRVLLTSGYATQSGPSEFPVLNKPYSQEELARAVRQVLDHPPASLGPPVIRQAS